MTMRLRFAPSPTGYLHMGGARTALFNWLLARRQGGRLLLRVEDTDRQRSSESHTRTILTGLSWLGLDWDEGPVFQSDGIERHRSEALRLLAEGRAYRDFTTPERLEAEAERCGTDDLRRLPRSLADALGDQESDRRAAAGDVFAVRFRVADGETAWDDLLHGELRFANTDIEDFVVLRSDGTPTYNMAVASDDADERITHVIRGDDHISNTPKQIMLYRALGYPVPAFGHLPMILGPDGRRLSKRHGATAVQEYQERGILPEALLNFLALLGWNPGDEREVMTRAELVEAFSLERVQKKSAVFDDEKLTWLNGQHLARRATAELVPLAAKRLRARGSGPTTWAGREAWFSALIDLLKVRARTVDELAEMAEPYVEDGAIVYAPDAVAQHWAKEPASVLERLERLRARLVEIPWEAAGLEQSIRALAEELGVGAGKVIHPLRVAVTGRQHSPGIFEVLVLLGRERTLARVEGALQHIRALLSSVS